MKLKGRNAKRLKKEKMKKTLRRMEKTRQIDSENLREVIKQKLAWSVKERQKGLDGIERTKIQIQRLNGIILFIKDLLEPPEKEGK